MSRAHLFVPRHRTRREVETRSGDDVDRTLKKNAYLRAQRNNNYRSRESRADRETRTVLRTCKRNVAAIRLLRRRPDRGGTARENVRR